MKIIKSLLLPLFIAILTSSLAVQQPEWCKKLPRAAYSKLERVPVTDPWFEVYKIRPGVFAIYEPHQLEEVISYLIIGDEKAADEKAGGDKALLFDTGMGISNIQAVVAGLTKLPVSVVNSHTHNDHVGDNWRFSEVYGMDTDFTRTNARGSTEDAQAELASDEICGALPAGFDAKAYATKPFHITHWLHDGDKIELGGRTLKVIATPGHTPDAIALLDEKNGLLFTGDSFYPRPDLSLPSGDRFGRLCCIGAETGSDGFASSTSLARTQCAGGRSQLSSEGGCSDPAGSPWRSETRRERWEARVFV
jgi:glyoxylase-like metal-dependent hydrolase (beta-lactamase superfamily II)